MNKINKKKQKIKIKISQPQIPRTFYVSSFSYIVFLYQFISFSNFAVYIMILVLISDLVISPLSVRLAAYFKVPSNSPVHSMFLSFYLFYCMFLFVVFFVQLCVLQICDNSVQYHL